MNGNTQIFCGLARSGLHQLTDDSVVLVIQKSPADLISYVRKIISSLAETKTLGYIRVPSSQIILLHLSPLSSSEKDQDLLNTMKTWARKGRDFWVPESVLTNSTQQLTPLSSSEALNSLRRVCVFGSDITFTQMSGDKGDQTNQAFMIRGATAMTGKRITTKAMGTPKNLFVQSSGKSHFHRYCENEP